MAIRSLLKSNENFSALFENKKMSSTDKVYHGCVTRYSDSTRLLIAFEKGQKCILERPKHADLDLKRLHPDKELNKKETCDNRTY